MRVDLDDEEAARIGALLSSHADAGVRRLAESLLDQLPLAAAVERWRVAGLALSTDGCGAPAAALKELGSDASESTAYRAWRRHYA